MENKLSPLEELRVERAKLKEDIVLHENKIKEDFSYLKNNWGSMIITSMFSSSTNSSKSESDSSFGKDLFGSSKLTSIVDGIIAVAPGIWSIAQPLLLGMITKRITSFIFGKKKKS